MQQIKQGQDAHQVADLQITLVFIDFNQAIGMTKTAESIRSLLTGMRHPETAAILLELTTLEFCTTWRVLNWGG